MKYIYIGELQVEIEKKHIKNMYLKILPPNGKVRVTAPIRMSEENIRKFLTTKLDWIHIQQVKMSNRHTHRLQSYEEGEEVYVWGKPYQLSLKLTLGRSSVQLTGERLYLSVKEASTAIQRKDILNGWYRQELMKSIPQLISKWEERIGVKASGFTIRDMKTRWGTCNIRTKKICLNLQLAKLHPQYLEYVIVHELVHLLESSHNHVFKGYMDFFLPEWRDIKKEMNGSQIPFEDRL